MDILRSVVAAAAMAVLSAGAAVTVAAPAQAFPFPPCTTVSGNSVTASAIEAWYYKECYEYDTPLSVKVERNVGGTWVTVASGSGFVTYQCSGTTAYTHRTTPEPEFTAACG